MNATLQTNSKNSVEGQQKSNLPTLLVKQQSLLPTHQVVAVLRERGELLLIRDRLRKRYKQLLMLIEEVEGLFVHIDDATKALNYYYNLHIELELTEKHGLAINAELEALPQEDMPFKEMKPAKAELVVADLIDGFLKLVGLDSDKNKLGSMLNTPAIIVSEFGWLTEAGLARVLKKALTGEHVIYGSLNLPTLCKWIRDYKDELDTAWLRQSETLHVQGMGDGNRGWEEREARKIASAQMAKKQRARDAAIERVNSEDYAVAFRNGRKQKQVQDKLMYKAHLEELANSEKEGD
jgi:hypothetical protein